MFDLESAIDTANIGRRPPHVEPDQRGLVKAICNRLQRDCTTGWTGEDQLPAACFAAADESSAAGHDAQLCGGVGTELALYPAQIISDDRGQVCVDDCRFTACNRLDHRCDFAAGADAIETDFFGDAGDDFFVDWVAVGMEQADGERANALIVELLQTRFRIGNIDLLQNIPMRVEPFVNFNDGFVERFSFDNTDRKEFGAFLVCDSQ